MFEDFAPNNVNLRAVTNPFGAGSGGYGSRARSTINGGVQRGDSWTPNVVIKQKQAGVKRRLVIFVLEDPESTLWGSEPIYRDGLPVDYIHT